MLGGLSRPAGHCAAPLDAHNQKGQSCKNAAIALGRLAKRPEVLAGDPRQPRD